MKIDVNNRTGEIDLRSGHSMFIGNKPEGITNEIFTDVITKTAEKRQESNEGIEVFGLWETATPNYATYYPDVTPEDLLPKDEDFIFPIFRCLSATILFKGYRPIDFSKPGVLKASMNKLIGQTINIDHETALGNGVGAVRSVSWQESYTSQGVKIPAGINGEFMIDGKSNPRIARGIQSKPPIIHSNSVSVRFTWEPSHKLDNNDEFFRKLGERDDKGNLYRLIVTEILSYSETSLVAHGADAYAQVLDEQGVINNPKYAAGVYNFSADDSNNKDHKFSHFLDYKVDLTSDTIPLKLNNNNNNNQNEESMEILKSLEVILGLDADSLKDADQAKLSEAITNFKESATSDLNEKLSTAEGKIVTLEADKEELQTKYDTLSKADNAADARKYQEVLTGKRTEAKKLYSLAKGVDANAEVLTSLDTCDAGILETLTAEYKSAVELKYPTSCKDCGGTNLSKASSTNDDDTNGDPSNKSKASLKEELKKKTRQENQLKK